MTEEAQGLRVTRRSENDASASIDVITPAWRIENYTGDAFRDDGRVGILTAARESRVVASRVRPVSSVGRVEIIPAPPERPRWR